MKLSKSPIIAAVLAILVSACTAPDTKTFPDITFTHLPKLHLAVGQVVTSSSFKSSYDLPRVENEMPVVPEKVVRRWAADRLVATGEGTGIATYTVTDARMTASALATDETLKDWFTDEQAVRYDISLAATLTIDDPAASAAGNAEAAASHSITVPEGATLNDREQAIFEMISKTAANLDRALEANIRRHLPGWIR
ncbi:MAG: hypothetical protein RIC16_14135 [Rhodospirillales bacterium]